MTDINQKIIAWAQERGILERSDPYSQGLKFIAEVGELADAVNKGDTAGIKLELGDVWVTLVLLAKLSGQHGPQFLQINDPPADNCNAKFFALRAAHNTGLIAANTICGKYEPVETQVLVIDLYRIAQLNALPLEQCVQAAYEKISQRQGQMVNGVFVKDGDPLPVPEFLRKKG